MQLTRTHLLINRLRRQLFSHVKLVRIGIIAICVGIFVGLFFLLQSPIYKASSFVRKFTGSGLVEHQGRTNFLVMGIGGENHDGSDLTDSMIFISTNRTNKTVSLISLPRDIWVASLRAKINTAYHYGFVKASTEGGILLSKSAVSEIINQPVDYVIILDFSTFSKAIDLIGGIDVTIDQTFDDYSYPIAGKENDYCNGDLEYSCRFEHLHFLAGPQHQNGETALKFVRSRYSTDEVEGTDFGRSKRQEKVMSAIVVKLLSISNLRHISIYTDLFHLLTNSTVTDLTPPQYFDLFSLFLTFRNTKPQITGLTDPEQLTHPPISPHYDNQWVLIAKGDNPQVVFDFVAKILDTP